jgi:DNA-binding CsgD family transcriptional regulator
MTLAVEGRRRSPGTDLLAAAAGAELARALVTDDEQRAALAAETLWRSTGSLSTVYGQIAQQLEDAGHGWAAGFTSLAVAHRLITASERLCARLRPLPLTQTRGHGAVLLAVPPDDPHTLALHALAHLLEDRGYRAVVGGNLPWEDLAELAAEEVDLVAVGLSLHQSVGVATVRRGLGVVRRAAGHAAVIVGGPSVASDPTLAKRLGADFGVTSAAAGLDRVDDLATRLSGREREVLSCIAAGMTNSETGEHLGLGAATVKSHLDRIFLKTGTTQRAAAVATALRKGWLH